MREMQIQPKFGILQVTSLLMNSNYHSTLMVKFFIDLSLIHVDSERERDNLDIKACESRLRQKTYLSKLKIGTPFSDEIYTRVQPQRRKQDKI